MKARILIAEDSTYMRMLLKELLIRSGYDVIGEADNGNDAVRLYDKYKPDIAAIDMLMPEMNGIDVTKIIKKDFPDIKVLILTMHLHRRMIIEALKAGADGYLMKDSKSNDFIEAAHAVLDGQIYLSHAVSTIIVREYIQKIDVPVPDSKNIECLSAREREILSLISQGMSTKMISKQLCISRNTVDTYRLNLMRKLDCENPTDLMRIAIREGAANLDE